MPKTIISCTICGEEAPNAGRDICQRCYSYLYRQARRAEHRLPRPVRTPLTERIEIEIALALRRATS